MTQEQALELAKKACDVEHGPGYYGRLWDSVAAAIGAAEQEAARECAQTAAIHKNTRTVRCIEAAYPEAFNV